MVLLYHKTPIAVGVLWSGQPDDVRTSKLRVLADYFSQNEAESAVLAARVLALTKGWEERRAAA